ncbi:MAG: hypothetical protein JWR32_2006 [Mycobacterium sp.]|nr:hypothetical protein [Mycobacterium sp.]
MAETQYQPSKHRQSSDGYLGGRDSVDWAREGGDDDWNPPGLNWPHFSVISVRIVRIASHESEAGG